MIPDEGFAEILTERLLIRRFRPSDAPRLSDYRSDPATAWFQSWATPFSVTDATGFIRDMLARHPGEPGQWFQFAITANGSEHVIGDCAVCCSSVPPPIAEIGCTLSSSFQGHGYAREALKAVTAYASAALGAEWVLGVTDRRNASARKLMRSMGWNEGPDDDLIPPSGPVGEDEVMFALRVAGPAQARAAGER